MSCCFCPKCGFSGGVEFCPQCSEPIEYEDANGVIRTRYPLVRMVSDEVGDEPPEEKL